MRNLMKGREHISHFNYLLLRSIIPLTRKPFSPVMKNIWQFTALYFSQCCASISEYIFSCQFVLYNSNTTNFLEYTTKTIKCSLSNLCCFMFCETVSTMTKCSLFVQFVQSRSECSPSVDHHIQVKIYSVLTCSALTYSVTWLFPHSQVE